MLIIYMENPEIPVGNQMVRIIPFGVLLKLWDYSFWDLQLMFINFACFPSSVKTKIPKISIRVVCVNGKHPISLLLSDHPSRERSNR